MKRNSLFVGAAVAALVVMSAPIVFAMPSSAESATYQMKNSMQGNESLPFALGVGATGDFVLDRTLDNSTDLEATWYGGVISIDPVDRLHLDLFVGAASFNLGNVGVSSPSTTKTELESNTTIGIGGSGKVDIVDFAVFPDQPNSWIFASGGYRWANPDVDGGTDLGRSPVLSMDMDVSEWQIGGGWSQRFNNLISGIGFVTYVGAAYSDVSIDLNGTGTYPAIGSGPVQTITTESANSDEVICMYVGAQIWGADDALMIGVEGRFISETAVSVTGKFRW